MPNSPALATFCLFFSFGLLSAGYAKPTSISVAHLHIPAFPTSVHLSYTLTQQKLATVTPPKTGVAEHIEYAQPAYAYDYHSDEIVVRYDQRGRVIAIDIYYGKKLLEQYEFRDHVQLTDSFVYPKTIVITLRSWHCKGKGPPHGDF